MGYLYGVPLMFNYKEEVKIDPFDLDVECLDQGRKVLGMAQLYADSIALRDHAKLSVEVIYANLSAKIRRNPKSFDIEGRPTDKTVENTVFIQKQYIRARQRLIRLNRDCELLKPGVETFKDRSIQIGRLIQLHLSGYFGKVKLPESSEEAVDNQRKVHERELLNKNPRLQKFSRRNLDGN